MEIREDRKCKSEEGVENFPQSFNEWKINGYRVLVSTQIPQFWDTDLTHLLTSGSGLLVQQARQHVVLHLLLLGHRLLLLLGILCGIASAGSLLWRDR